MVWSLGFRVCHGVSVGENLIVEGVLSLFLSQPTVQKGVQHAQDLFRIPLRRRPSLLLRGYSGDLHLALRILLVRSGFRA